MVSVATGWRPDMAAKWYDKRQNVPTRECRGTVEPHCICNATSAGHEHDRNPSHRGAVARDRRAARVQHRRLGGTGSTAGDLGPDPNDRAAPAAGGRPKTRSPCGPSTTARQVADRERHRVLARPRRGGRTACRPAALPRHGVASRLRLIHRREAAKLIAPTPWRVGHAQAAARSVSDTSASTA